jgi:hypothetical protein
MSPLIARKEIKTTTRKAIKLTQDVHCEHVISLVDLLQRSNRNFSMCIYRFCSAIRGEKKRKVSNKVRKEGTSPGAITKRAHKRLKKRDPKAEKQS